MTTLPAAVVAPRSVTNLPRNSCSLPVSIAMMKLPLVFGMPSRPACAGALQRRCNPAATQRRRKLSGDQGRGGEGRAMRARYPDAEGFVERDGVKIAYEVFGSGGPS